MNLETASLKPRITLIDGRVMTTSLVVAEHFSKQHKDVLRAIDHAMAELTESFRERNFALTYRGVRGPNGAQRKEPVYRMTRDGFALIAMGFTGRQAMAWKVAYINTFNAMEAALLRKLERPAATSATAPAVNPVMRGLPPFTPRPYLELLHAVDLDTRAAYLVCYLLATGAHRQVLHASYREICAHLSGCFTPRGLPRTIRRLSAWELIDFVPGRPPRTPSTFVLHLTTLIERIAAVQAATDDYLGLADSEIPLDLLH